MSRTTKAITCSLPAKMAEQVDEVVKREGSTKSALLREALRRYIAEREWQQLFENGRQRAREGSIIPEEVNRLVEEFQASEASL